MKELKFPDHFFWGTSTAAAQIETAAAHNWRGVVAKDGYTFQRTSDHELRRIEDAGYIKELGSIYRCGVDWASLQTAPFADFNPQLVAEYQAFFQHLQDAGVKLMFVIHHFTNPLWFEEKGGWLVADNIPAFLHYAQQCMQHFGRFVVNWNTFNEPNVYAMNAYMLGNFPPMKKSYFKANRVLKNMGKAHHILYKVIKKAYPDTPVGISFNTGYFQGKNFLGRIAAKFTDWWFHRKAAKPFTLVDYWGLSYYAYIIFKPGPITEIDNPGQLAKMGLPHDKMWGYNPDGLARILRRFHRRYGKPMIITENGICTEDQEQRIQAIKDYLSVCHQAIADGIDLRGYVHWTTMDNFEWHLGPTYRFGLVWVDLETKDRKMTAAGEFYAQVAKNNSISV